LRPQGRADPVEWVHVQNRFDEILYALNYSPSDPPAFLDKFWQIRDMVAAWNENMSKVFVPSWISCLDESMSPWTNQWSCPGFMYVPRKPHPFGNEYHSICCGLSGLMYRIDLVEGKDNPPQVPKEFSEKTSTTALLLRMTKGIHHSGRMVVLDSGFCVLKALIELRQHGVFAAAVVKKRRYWPKYIDGEGIKQHFEDRPVGSADAVCGTLEGVPFNVTCVNDVDYINIMMATYGTMTTGVSNNRRRLEDGSTANYLFPEVLANHKTYKAMVDCHNARRHSPLSFEERWATKVWPNRVFAFLLAITEVNVMLAEKYFIRMPSIRRVCMSFVRHLRINLSLTTTLHARL
jgi:Transposase IS4